MCLRDCFCFRPSPRYSHFPTCHLWSLQLDCRPFSFGRKRALRAYKGLGTRLDCHGTVRVVFASVAMGVGIDLHGVDTIFHYGAPSSIEDYFQASGRRG